MLLPNRNEINKRIIIKKIGTEFLFGRYLRSTADGAKRKKMDFHTQKSIIFKKLKFRRNIFYSKRF